MRKYFLIPLHSKVDIITKQSDGVEPSMTDRVKEACLSINVVQCSLFKTKVFVSPRLVTGQTRPGGLLLPFRPDLLYLISDRISQHQAAGHCSHKNHCNKISTPPFPLSIEYYAGDIEMYYLISRTQLKLTKYIEQPIRVLQLRRRNRREKSISILDYFDFEHCPCSHEDMIIF